MSHHFAICTSNVDNEVSLEPRKLYEVIDDPDAKKIGMLRVIDESGEDYLYPAEHFIVVQLPEVVEEKIAHLEG